MAEREKMSKEMRAKQFMPFDALKGLRAALREKEIEHEMEEASGYIRHELANRIDIRHTPKLVFKFDESVKSP